MSYVGAPYNFITLPENIKTVSEVPTADRYHQDRLSGYFMVTITALTPIYTRSSLTEDENKKKQEAGVTNWRSHKPEFFSPGFDAKAQPRGDITPFVRIPGSSLRGMIRNLVEIVSQSEMDGVSHDMLFYRALADVNTSPIGAKYKERMFLDTNSDVGIRAGFIVRKGMKYYYKPAKTLEGSKRSYFRIQHSLARYIINQFRNSNQNPQSGEVINRDNWSRLKIWFKVPTEDITVTVVSVTAPRKEDEANWIRGWLISPGAEPPPRVDKRGKSLDEVRRIQDIKRGNKKHWIISEIDSSQNGKLIEDEDLFPYRDGGGISQAIETNRFSVLPRNNDDKNAVPCFYVEWTDNDGIKHVSFGHTAYFRLPYVARPFERVPKTILKQDKPEENKWDLAEAIFGSAAGSRKDGRGGRVFFEDAKLMSGQEWEEPKHPMILSSPKPTTFQHYLRQRPGSRMDELNFWDSPGAQISGYKLYWHRSQKQADYWVESNPVKDEDKQHTIIRPFKAGAIFKSRVRFENLNGIELGVLITVLALPEGAAHKLGMGKPLGLGSVKLDISLNLIDRPARYNSLFDITENNVISWTSGEKQVSREELAKYVQKFENFLGVSANSSLWQQPRLAELKAMLNFATKPDFEQTRYMQIENIDEQTGMRVNEYRTRPILLPVREVVKLELVEPPKNISAIVSVIGKPPQSSTKPSVPEPPADLPADALRLYKEVARFQPGETKKFITSKEFQVHRFTDEKVKAAFEALFKFKRGEAGI